MFRPLRRAFHALNETDTKELLLKERRGVLAMTGDEGRPYAVPISFYYDEPNDRLLFHSSPIGHKADSLEKDDRVCFTVYGAERIDPAEPWAPYMRSAVVFGRCRRIADAEKHDAALRLFALKYYPDAAAAENEISRSGRAAAMYEIMIEHMTGKEIQEK